MRPMVSNMKATNILASEKTQDGNLFKRTPWNISGLKISKLSAFLAAMLAGDPGKGSVSSSLPLWPAVKEPEGV